MLLNTLLFIKPKWRGENVVGPDLKIDNTYPSNRICLGDKVVSSFIPSIIHESQIKVLLFLRLTFQL